MMHRALSLIILVMLVSCESEPDPDHGPDPVEYDRVVAGDRLNVGIYHAFAPSIIETSNQGSLWYFGSDSFDIDDSGIFDLAFSVIDSRPDMMGEYCPCDEDTTVICDCWPEGSMNKSLHILDTLFQVSCDENFYVKHYSRFDTINIASGWDAGSQFTLSYHFYFPPGYDPEGCWVDENEGYIAIRRIGEDTAYGWIHIDLAGTLEISESYLLTD